MREPWARAATPAHRPPRCSRPADSEAAGASFAGSPTPAVVDAEGARRAGPSRPTSSPAEGGAGPPPASVPAVPLAAVPREPFAMQLAVARDLAAARREWRRLRRRHPSLAELRPAGPAA